MQNKPFFLSLAVFFLFSYAAFAQSDTCKVGLNTKILKISTTKNQSDRAADNIAKIETNCYLGYGRLQIFSRWGEVLFDEKNTNNGFNGIVKGKALSEGVYVYIITYQKPGDDKELKETGQLMIMKE